MAADDSAGAFGLGIQEVVENIGGVDGLEGCAGDVELGGMKRAGDGDFDHFFEQLDVLDAGDGAEHFAGDEHGHFFNALIAEADGAFVAQGLAAEVEGDVAGDFAILRLQRR